MFIKYIGSIVVLHLNKVKEKIFSFKRKKVQETTFKWNSSKKKLKSCLHKNSQKYLNFIPEKINYFEPFFKNKILIQEQ